MIAIVFDHLRNKPRDKVFQRFHMENSERIVQYTRRMP
jgi:hypothetical protein